MDRSRAPKSSLRRRKSQGEGVRVAGVRALAMERRPSEASALTTSREVRPGLRSSSSTQSGSGLLTFCTTAPASARLRAAATTASSLGCSDTGVGAARDAKKNGPGHGSGPGPSHPSSETEADRYFRDLRFVFFFVFRAAGFFFAVFLFFFAAIASLRFECAEDDSDARWTCQRTTCSR